MSSHLKGILEKEVIEELVKMWAERKAYGHVKSKMQSAEDDNDGALYTWEFINIFAF